MKKRICTKKGQTICLPPEVYLKIDYFWMNFLPFWITIPL